MQPSIIPYRVRKVVVIGGGVTGTAFAKVLCQYTNINSITLLEKNNNVAEVNSHPLNNAQTSHDGSTETNYNLDHALDVKFAADLLRHYALKTGDPNLFKITNRMALAVGSEEVAKLKARFAEFREHYPDLRLIGAEELREIEPNVMIDRGPNEEVAALISDQGFAINYQVLADYMLNDAINSGKDFEVMFNSEVDHTRVYRDEQGLFVLPTTVTNDDGRQVEVTIRAEVVVFAAGAYSLLFAQQLGYGLNYTIFPVAGSFFSGGKLLNGKVYRVQIEGMPFAAIHGDPDILNQDDTRFGPSTKPLPLMERHHYDTAMDYFRSGVLSWRGMLTIIKILFNRQLLWYVIKNQLFDIPGIGTWLFLREVRPIVPSIKFSQLKLRRGAGGIRPQVVNMDKRRLEMGDSCIIGDKAIFNTTPSPGASICLSNAVRDVGKVVEFFGEGYHFDRAGFLDDLGITDREVKHEVMVA